MRNVKMLLLLVISSVLLIGCSDLDFGSTLNAEKEVESAADVKKNKVADKLVDELDVKEEEVVDANSREGENKYYSFVRKNSGEVLAAYDAMTDFYLEGDGELSKVREYSGALVDLTDEIIYYKAQNVPDKYKEAHSKYVQAMREFNEAGKNATFGLFSEESDIEVYLEGVHRGYDYYEEAFDLFAAAR